MGSSLYPFYITIALGPLAALVGGIVVVLLAQDLVVGVLAGVAGLAAGLVVGYVFMEMSFDRWPSEYDDIGLEAYERAQREHGHDFDSWPESIAIMFAMALIFGGTITALVVTLAAGWLLSS